MSDGNTGITPGAPVNAHDGRAAGLLGPGMAALIDQALGSLPQPDSRFERDRWRIAARVAADATAPVIAAQAAAAERQRLRSLLLDGDPGVLEQRFRALVDDEEAADCALIVSDLLRQNGDTDG